MSSTHSAAARRFRAKGPILHTAMDRDHLSTDHLSTNEVWLQKPIYGDRETTKKRPSSPSSRFGLGASTSALGIRCVSYLTD